MKVNDHYKGSDHREFRVIDIWVDEGHEWVRYEALDTKQEYTCYTEAFISRFHRTVNDG